MDGIDKTTNAAADTLSGREIIERELLQRCAELKPLEPGDLTTITPYKDGSFAVSLLGFMLYGNGFNLRGPSRLCRGGLLYHDGENLFSCGIFRKHLDSPRWHVMINAPRGKTWFTAVQRLIATVEALGNNTLGETYIRHLTAEQHEIMMAHGYRRIDVSPWDPEAPSEDETHNHKLIVLDDIIAIDDEDTLAIKKLQGEGSRSFRAKARLSFNRFENFLRRNQLSLEIENYTTKTRTTAENLVRRHFRLLKNPVGSTPEDYLGLIGYDPAHGGDQCFAKLGFLCGQGRRLPILFYMGEKTASDTLALYATFASRDTCLLTENIDPQGFTAISQYVYLTLFGSLYREGIRRVNLGGSETEDLNKFKRQLGASCEMSYWVVRDTGGRSG